jgi:hypothetical protein
MLLNQTSLLSVPTWLFSGATALGSSSEPMAIS